MIPGEVMTAPGELDINAGREAVILTVANSGDRPVQVGSHYHFAETNTALQFDRRKARGCRLETHGRAGGDVEPGQTREVRLIPLAGTREVYGFRQAIMGSLDKASRKRGSAP